MKMKVFCDKTHRNREKMIGCGYDIFDECKEWYHIKCIGMTGSNGKNINFQNAVMYDTEMTTKRNEK